MVNFEVLDNGAKIGSAIVAFISFACTVLTILLIFDMNKWNGYMLLIYNLSLCQLLSDFSFLIITYSLYGDADQLRPYKFFLFTFGCVSVSLWTNLISCILFNVVIYRRNVNIHKNFNTIRACIIFPGLALAVSFAAYPNKYYDPIEGATIWLQIASVLFNIVVCMVVSIALRRMGIQNDADNSSNAEVNNNNRETTHSSYNPDIYKPIVELSRRIKYYPVVQIICLLGVTWYFFAYSLGLFGPRHDATLQTVAWFAYCILSPAAGIGYFIVFLTVQPYAHSRLKVRIREVLGLPVDRTLSRHSEIYRASTASSMRGSEVDSTTLGSSSISTAQTRTTLGVTFMSSLTASTISTLNVGTLECAMMDDDALIERIARMNGPVHMQGTVRENPMIDTGDAAL